MVDLFMEMSQAWGMNVSLDKTKIMAINPTTPLTPFVYGPTERLTIKVVQEICLPWYELGGCVCNG